MTEGGPATPDNGGGIAPWVWIALALAGIVLIVVVVLVATSDGDEESATTTTAATTTTEEETTTTEEETTTTAEETTTTAEETTTTAEETTTTAEPPPAVEVPPTPIVALLGTDIPPYGGGAELFPPGSVEANWYVFEDFYVVLYRGLNAQEVTPLCPGNSINVGGPFLNVSNSPVDATAEEVCVGVPNVAELPAGARVCDTLLYYLTEITTDLEGVLYGTAEINTGAGFDGQTSIVESDLANTPDFVPDQAAYALPASGVDEAHTVSCG